MAAKKRQKKSKAVKLRCFFGIQFPLTRQLGPLLDRLAQLSADPDSHLRLVAPEYMHITMKFLGSVEESRLAELQNTAQAICSEQAPLQISARGLGFFKNSIWVGIADNPALTALAGKLDKGFETLGIVSDNKPFVPHVTLARFNRDAKIKLSSLQDEFRNSQHTMFEATQLQLFRSETLPEGARYTVINSFPFSGD